MRALSNNQRAELLAALDLAVNTWEDKATNLAPVFDLAEKAQANGWVLFVGAWDDRHGPCTDCGLPAAFLVEVAGHWDPNHRFCAVCAANHAADGARIKRIED